MNAIHPISDPDKGTLRDAWSCVFSSSDPFSSPFTSVAEGMLLFYPTDGYHLTREQYAALLASVRRIGEESFLLSVVEYSGDWISRGQHWKCNAPSYEQYLGLELTLENALYSERGNWGLLISHEAHGVIGGGKDFIAALKQSYPKWMTDAERLRHDWVNIPDSEWVDKLLGAVQRASA